MKISQAERSKYYRGLLILVGRDRIIDPRERALMIQIGRILDFDERFCDTAMDDLPRNVHLRGGPVVFSRNVIAECFLLDAVRLALVDKKIHPHELAWLRKVARANGLSDSWLDDALRRCPETDRIDPSSLFLVQEHL